MISKILRRAPSLSRARAGIRSRRLQYL